MTSRRQFISPLILLICMGFLTGGLHPLQDSPATAQEVPQRTLAYYQDRHRSGLIHDLRAESQDTLIGEPAIATHQIVLISEADCSPCLEAQRLIEQSVLSHPTAVHLVVKDIAKLPSSVLEELHLKRLPAIFVDGRLAEGWDFPGFLDVFIQDCGC